jgi:2-polyprenyl-3-methyl-5-hydroxy-6-metoxy-1,4-benzoquinol methylase
VNYTGPAREQVRSTRPGTPMIGPYSVNQMDDFYVALGSGQVKPTGIMNYIQRLFIAERCTPGATVIDVCCGRGLQLPALYRYAPRIASYLGLDIAGPHLGDARARAWDLDQTIGNRSFTVEFAHCDVAEPWPAAPPADVVIFTSALEHLPREAGAASLRHASAALSPAGTLFLSTPNTLGDPPRLLQHGVHVYEWADAELRAVLADVGLAVHDTIGLLPPAPEITARVLAEQYGPGAARWYDRLAAIIPEPFLATVSAAALGSAAAEIMYLCRRRQ